MANEKNGQQSEGQQPRDEKLRYLRRGEVRTMEKDLSALREKETQEERERVAKLRIQEQAQKEKEGQAEAQEEFLARKKAAEEIKRKEEDLVRLRQEREEKEKALIGGETTKLEERKEGFKEAMGEVQSREEAERKRFLERVAAKAEGREEVPEPPKPEPKEVKPEIKTEKPKEIKEYKPYKVAPRNIWLRIILLLLTLAILSAVATFWYWYFAVREEPVREVVPPPPPAEEPPAEEPPTEEIPEVIINEKILDFGYHIPLRPRTIDAIIIHSAYDAFGEDPYNIDSVIEEYRTQNVTGHYLIARNGEIFQLAPEEAIAYHAGISRMPDGRTSVNNFSIGIGLIYTETEEPTNDQYLALAQMVKYLQQEYDIPAAHVLGHKNIAPDRKTTPWNFDWNYFNSLIK